VNRKILIVIPKILILDQEKSLDEWKG